MTAAAPPQRMASSAQPAGSYQLQNTLISIATYGVLIPLSISFAFPLYWMITSAMKVDTQVFTYPPILFPVPMHPRNFIDGWQVLPFTRYAVNSIVFYTAPVVLLTVLSSTIVAYGFSRIRWPGRDALFLVVVMTMMLPWAVTMVPLFITFKSLNWLDTYRPLVVPALFGHPYIIFLLRQFLMTLPMELSDAARIDGASEFGLLFRILLPLIKPALAVVCLFRFLWAWNDYLGPLIYLRDESKYPLALGIEQLSQRANGFGAFANGIPYLMAVSTIVALPIIVTFFLAQRTFIEGISLTGVKG